MIIEKGEVLSLIPKLSLYKQLSSLNLDISNDSFLFDKLSSPFSLVFY